MHRHTWGLVRSPAGSGLAPSWRLRHVAAPASVPALVATRVAKRLRAEPEAAALRTMQGMA